MKKPSDISTMNRLDIFKRFVFMWNDGIGFFSTLADHKLPRLTGGKPGWFDKYKNTRNIVMYLISASVIISVLASQLVKYDTRKSQEVKLVPHHEFNFTSNDNMPLIGCFYLNVDALFDKIIGLEALAEKPFDTDMTSVWA